MTIYFAPPGEPIDGDNWRELGMLESDGYQFEQDRLGEWQGQEISVAAVDETSIEIFPEISGWNRANKDLTELKTRRSASFTFELEDAREFVNAMFGYDVYALRATVAEWLNRPAPMPSIPKAELIEMQDGINRLAFYAWQASERYATPHPLKGK